METESSDLPSSPFIKCADCGYSLQGATEPGRCPECGTAYGGDIFIFRQISLFSPFNFWIALALLLAMICLGGLLFYPWSSLLYAAHSDWPIVVFVLCTAVPSIVLVYWRIILWNKKSGLSQFRILPTQMQFMFAGKTTFEVPFQAVTNINIRKLPGMMWVLRLDGIHSIAIRPRFILWGTPDEILSLQTILKERIGSN